MSLFFLYLFAYFIIFGYNYWPYFILGLFFATKQTNLIFLPFIIALKGINFKKFFLSLGTFFVIVIPFVLWNWHDFLFDVVMDQIQYVDPLFSLSFNTLYKTIFFQAISQYLIFVILAALYVFIIFRTLQTLRGMLLSAVILLMALFLIKRGFANYYYFISGVIILLSVLEIIGDQPAISQY